MVSMAVSSPRALLAASSARAVAGDSGSYIRFVVGFDSELSWPWCKAALATVLLLTCTVLWLSRPFRQSSTGDGAGRQSCTGDDSGRQSSTGDGAGRHSSTGDGAGRQNSRTACWSLSWHVGCSVTFSFDQLIGHLSHIDFCG